MQVHTTHPQHSLSEEEEEEGVGKQSVKGSQLCGYIPPHRETRTPRLFFLLLLLSGCYVNMHMQDVVVERTK